MSESSGSGSGETFDVAMVEKPQEAPRVALEKDAATRVPPVKDAEALVEPLKLDSRRGGANYLTVTAKDGMAVLATRIGTKAGALVALNQEDALVLITALATATGLQWEWEVPGPGFVESHVISRRVGEKEWEEVAQARLGRSYSELDDELQEAIRVLARTAEGRSEASKEALEG